jgi:hypothetical protein
LTRPIAIAAITTRSKIWRKISLSPKLFSWFSENVEWWGTLSLERTGERFDLKPKRLAADTAYRTDKFLGWLVKEKKITPHIPVWEKSDRQDGIFSRSDFQWDKKRRVYVCLDGKRLHTSDTVHEDAHRFTVLRSAIVTRFLSE